MAGTRYLAHVAADLRGDAGLIVGCLTVGDRERAAQLARELAERFGRLAIQLKGANGGERETALQATGTGG